MLVCSSPQFVRNNRVNALSTLSALTPRHKRSPDSSKWHGALVIVQSPQIAIALANIVLSPSAFGIVTWQQGQTAKSVCRS